MALAEKGASKGKKKLNQVIYNAVIVVKTSKTRGINIPNDALRRFNIWGKERRGQNRGDVLHLGKLHEVLLALSLHRTQLYTGEEERGVNILNS